MANKRPLSGPRARVRELRALAEERGTRIRAETTVGAALPILDTYAKLVESGDRVRRIDACPSGTLGFLFDELGRGEKFSAALRDAMARGYTEPDPRDDLTGMDVARKGLILGRLVGFPGELGDVTVESLVTQSAARMPLASFLSRLEMLDDAWSERVARARARGGVLRYQVSASARKVSVGLVVADSSSPMASLRGTDNQFVFVSDRYNSQPVGHLGAGCRPGCDGERCVERFVAARSTALTRHASLSLVDTASATRSVRRARVRREAESTDHGALRARAARGPLFPTQRSHPPGAHS